MVKTFLGFVSDMDGVITDTEELWLVGTNNFLQKFGATITREEYSGCIGKPPIENTRILRKKYALLMPENEVHAARLKEVISAHNTNIKLNDGYLDFLQILKNNIKISLASNSPPEIINKILGATKIRHYFIAAVSADETGSKVGAYKKAVAAMGLKPEECFALEDSLSGVRAAKEAGLYCIAIPSQFLSGADFSIADEVHKDIREVLRDSSAIKAITVK